MACFKKAGRYLKEFSNKAPGRRPKRQKLLKKFRCKPKFIPTLIKKAFAFLIITRIVLSIIPMELHPYHPYPFIKVSDVPIINL